MNRQKTITKIITVVLAFMIAAANLAYFAAPTAAQSTEVPVLIGPTGIQSTNQPVFQWTMSPNPRITSYELIMFDDGEPYSKTIYTLDQLKIEGEKVTLETGETFGVGNFSWAVRYILSDGTISGWSEPFVFNILPDVSDGQPDPSQPAEPTADASASPTPEAEVTAEVTEEASLMALAADANTFYVSPNGNDSNAGTEASPWKTIGTAANRMKAGQTLYVRGGTYNQNFTITASGTSSSPIRILAYPGETPVIDGNNYALPSSNWGAMIKIAGNYVNMTGFEVRYTNWMAVVISGNNNVVSNFNVHHNKENGILITGNNDTVKDSKVWQNCLSNQGGVQTRSGWSSGLSAARRPTNAVLKNNVVYENWGEGLSTYEASGTIMEGNIVHDNYATNVYISDATNVILRNNFIYATAGNVVSKGARVGIMMGDEVYNPVSSNIQVIDNIVMGAYRNFYWWQGTKGGGMKDVLIANNTFVNSRATTNVQINNASHSNVRFVNNIISQTDSLSIAILAGSGVTYSNNLWSKNPGSPGMGSSSVVADPAFVKSGNDASAGYYGLTASSQAINRGVNLSETSKDYDYAGRVGAWDIGAKEYQGQPSTNPTAAPTTAPTSAPTTAPTTAPTKAPTTAPTTAPTAAPTNPSSNGNPVNLALKKAVTQSSTYTSTKTGTASAELAVDGNTNGNFYKGSVAHTKKDAQAWWQVDLGAVQNIKTVDVWNRSDDYTGRLQKFYVFVSDVPFKSGSLSEIRNQAGVTGYYVSGTAGRPTHVAVNRTGRYVRIQLSATNNLALAEVQVWGTTGNGGSNPAPTTGAPQPTATQPAPTAQPTTAPVSGAFYVATNGSDANAGTQSSPWKTIQYAVNRLSAGQTLYVRGGTYRETVNVSKSGTAANNIKILAYPGETPILDGNNYALPSSSWGAMLKISGSYIQMTGFEVRYTNWMAVVVSGSNSIVSAFNVHHNKENGILVTGNNNIVEKSSVWMNCLSNQGGVATRSGWASGLSAARHPNNTILRKNTVYQNWGEGLSTYEANGTIMEDNVVYNNYSANVYISDATNVTLQRNFVYATADSVVNKGARVGIMLGDEVYNPASSNIKVINNVAVSNYRNFYWWQGSKGGGMKNVTIANNTFVNSRATTNFQINNASHQSVQVYNNIITQSDSLSIAIVAGTGVTYSNNLWSKTPGSLALGNNSIVADPSFAKTGSQVSIDWYKLVSGSPAINKGATVPSVSDDFTGYKRPSACDIGAYEYR